MTDTPTPATVAVILDRLRHAAGPSYEEAVIESAVTAALMWRCPCQAANDGNDLEETACGVCGAPRLWTEDRTPPRCEYGQLLTGLRDALRVWFDDRPHAPRPAAVTFHVTTTHADGPAWSPSGVTVHFPDSPDGMDYPHDFDQSGVADALTEISKFDPPQKRDVLRVVVPAL